MNDTVRENPYAAPSTPREADTTRESASSSPFRGLLYAPLGASVASLAEAALFGLMVLLSSVDNPAFIPVMLVAAVTLVPATAAIGAILAGTPLVWGLRRFGMLKWYWVLLAGVICTFLLVVCIGALIAWTDRSHSVSNVVPGLILVGLYVGVPCFSCFVAYAYWLERDRRLLGTTSPSQSSANMR